MEHPNAIFPEPKYCEAKSFPCSLKVYVSPFHFYERPTLVPVFPDQQKPKENLCFYENSRYCAKGANETFQKSGEEMGKSRNVGRGAGLRLVQVHHSPNKHLHMLTHLEAL